MFKKKTNCCDCDFDNYCCDDFIPDDDEIDEVEEGLKGMLLDSYTEVWNAKYGGAFVDRHGTNVFIKKVIYHKPKVTIIWNDGVKSVASCTAGDEKNFSFESGLNIAINNRLYGYDEMNRLYDDWLPDRYTDEKIDIDDLYEVTISDVRKHYKIKYAIEDTLAEMYIEKNMKDYLESKGYKVTK